MKNSSKQIDRKILKTLEPLNRLNPILLDELAAKSIIDEVPAGRIICRHGEKDSRQIYLLSGQIEVAVAGKTKTKIIKSKSALKTPVAEGSPRTVTLKAKTASTLLYIDADLLELLMSDEPELTSTYDVTEISVNDDDWMLTFLQSPVFLQLPTENIQKLLTHMEEIPVKKDQVVINQGDKDNNYYIIKSGTCNVHRKPHKDAANILLAVLPTGSGFGEEALISNGSRNATITMRENGTLMRLKKNDFLTLLVNPLIHYFEHNETQKKLNEGCVVIDVRSEQQSKQKPLEGSINIPLSMLRVKFGSLNADSEYLLVCNDGSQSAAAAFLMIQHGLKCSVLKNGLNNSKNNNETDSTAKSVAATRNKQTEQIVAQQKQIKAAREKAEQDIIKHKKELSESRARIAQKNQQLSSIQTEAAQLKEKAQAENKAVKLRAIKEAEQEVQVIEEEILVELVTEAVPAKSTTFVEQGNIDYKAVSIPGMLTDEPISLIDDDEAKRKAEAIKAKLTQSQTNKIHKTILDVEEDLFAFHEPESTTKQPVIAQRTRAESVLTQIATKAPQESYPQQEQETAIENNPFLNPENSQVSTRNYANLSESKKSDFANTKNVQPFNKQAHIRKHQNSKSNTLAIAASFLMILAGAVFTLHATNTLKIQSIAALFNSGNDTIQAIAVTKTKATRKKVLRADTKVNMKKKVNNKMDDIMQGWKEILSESKNPKKSQNNQ